MIESHVAALSTYARDIDNLIILIGVMVGFWFILCEGIFFWLIFAYRAKEGVWADYITGDEKHLKRWVTWPHLLVLVCDVFIIIGAVRVWYDIKQHLPEPYATVRVIGQHWTWSFVPVFRLKQDAIPGRVITGWFEATGTGSYDIQCAEICGYGHGLMVGRIVIETPEQHAAWMAEHSTTKLAAR